MKKIVSAALLMILVTALTGCASSVTSFEERTRIIDSKNISSIH